MPESSFKYYPVVAQILLLLGENTIVTFRASIITSKSELEVGYRMVHRFVMEYKGPSHSCGEHGPHCDMYCEKALEYLQRKMTKTRRFEGKSLEPMVRIQIDLRGVKPTAVTMPMT